MKTLLKYHGYIIKRFPVPHSRRSIWEVFSPVEEDICLKAFGSREDAQEYIANKLPLRRKRTYVRS